MSKNELHELLMGAALVALAYAVYAHNKSVKNARLQSPLPTASEVAASDQAAIETAIATGPGVPDVYVPPMIEVEPGTDGGNWLTNLMQGAL